MNNMPGNVSRISVSIDPELLTEFDKATEGYSRSTAIQQAMRDFLTEHKWKDQDGPLAGVITMMYDHHIGNVTEELTHLQHDYTEIINSSTHIHLDHDNCLEMLVVKGESHRIKQLAERLTATRGVKQIKITLLQ